MAAQAVNLLEGGAESALIAAREVSYDVGRLGRLMAVRSGRTECRATMDDGSAARLSGCWAAVGDAEPKVVDIRFWPGVSVERLIKRALWMALRRAAVGLRGGVLALGIDAPRHGLSRAERERIERSLLESLGNQVPARHDRRRAEAVGVGAAACGVAAVGGRPGSRFAIVGLSLPALEAARRLTERGARVVAVGDRAGGVAGDLTGERIAEYRVFRRAPAGTSPLESADLLRLDVDGLLLLSDALAFDSRAAETIAAPLVIEGVPGAIVVECARTLSDGGATVVPDLLAARGDLVAGALEDVEVRLDEAFRRAVEVSRASGLDLRTGACLRALEVLQETRS